VQKKLDDLRPQVRDLRTDSRKLKDENHHVRSELDEAKSKNEELIATNEDLEKARLEALDDVSMMEIKSTLIRGVLYQSFYLTCIYFCRRPPVVNDG